MRSMKYKTSEFLQQEDRESESASPPLVALVYIAGAALIALIFVVVMFLAI